MKDNRKYLFIGSRFNVLEKMLSLKLNITNILVTPNSFAEEGCKKNNLKYKVFRNKQEAIELIDKAEFDVLVSNGCPYILPVSSLKKQNELFINVHPGLLPELRGGSPVNASILFNKAQGVTCHIMDDGIDTGDVISRVVVTKKQDIPLELLYKLSFMAEGDAFVEAYRKNFKTHKVNAKSSMYYSRKIEDQIITKKDSLDLIIKKVKAFQVDGQFARFIKNENNYLVKDIIKFKNVYLNSHKYKSNSIILIFNNKILTKEKDCYLLWTLDNTNNLNVGDKLF